MLPQSPLNTLKGLFLCNKCCAANQDTKVVTPTIFTGQQPSILPCADAALQPAAYTSPQQRCVSAESKPSSMCGLCISANWLILFKRWKEDWFSYDISRTFLTKAISNDH